MRDNLNARKCTKSAVFSSAPLWIVILHQGRNPCLYWSLVLIMRFFFLGYSGSDMANLCREAALGPIRSITDIQCIDADQVWIKPSSVLTWMVPCPILHHPSSSCIAFYRAYSHFIYTKSSLAHAHAQYRLHSDRQRTILNMCYELGMKNNLSPPRGFES